jgi:Replication-relaxation
LQENILIAPPTTLATLLARVVGGSQVSSMPLPDRLQITPQDREIFKHLYDHRMLRIDHLMKLTGRGRDALKKRLYKLRRHGYLACKVRPFKKHIYALAKKAVEELAGQGIASKEEASRRIRHSELRDLFLDHFMMIVDFHVCLTLATRSKGLALTWRQGEELKDSVTASVKGKVERLSVWPDSFFTISDPKGSFYPLHCVFEADRSTEDKRFLKKILAYVHYFAQRGHVKKYGIETFRVVTATISRQRASNLCALAGQVVPTAARKFFLFSSFDEDFLSKPLRILENVFITPRDSQRRALVEPGQLASTRNLM